FVHCFTDGFDISYKLFFPAIFLMQIQKSCHSGLQIAMVVVLHNIPEVFFKGFWQLECYHRCPFHTYTASACGLVSFPRKRESRRRGPWGLDARRSLPSTPIGGGHDVLLSSDLRNIYLDVNFVSPAPVSSPGSAGLQPASRSHAGAWRSQAKPWRTGSGFIR